MRSVMVPIVVFLSAVSCGFAGKEVKNRQKMEAVMPPVYQVPMDSNFFKIKVYHFSCFGWDSEERLMGPEGFINRAIGIVPYKEPNFYYPWYRFRELPTPLLIKK